MSVSIRRVRALGNHADLTRDHMDETTLMKTDELINLEREVSEGNASPGALRRLERLKHKNEKDTLGLLAKALHSYEFRDDVLHTARLRDSKYLGECAKDPRWATVEVLDLGWNSLKRLGLTISDFLASMPLLHTLSLLQIPHAVVAELLFLHLEAAERGSLGDPLDRGTPSVANPEDVPCPGERTQRDRLELLGEGVGPER